MGGGQSTDRVAESIGQLERQRDKFMDDQAKYRAQANKLIQNARECHRTGRKQEALQWARRWEESSNQCKILEGYISTIQAHINAANNVEHAKNLEAAIKQNVAVLSKAKNSISSVADRVADSLQDSEELQDLVVGISANTQPLGQTPDDELAEMLDKSCRIGSAPLAADPFGAAATTEYPPVPSSSPALVALNDDEKFLTSLENAIFPKVPTHELGSKPEDSPPKYTAAPVPLNV